MYSIYNEEKSVVPERFIRTLKTRFISIWQLCEKMFILMFQMILLIDTITFRRTIKMKHIDVKSDSYAEYNVDSIE